MKIIITALALLFSAQTFANQTQYPRVMACQTPDAKLYLEIFHDQEGMLGAPTKPTGYLVLWATTMGKDTQKRLVLDVPMKHAMSGGTCMLDIKWSQRMMNGAEGTSNYNVIIAGCAMAGNLPKGKLTQEDVYKSGKVVTASADLNCQLQ